MPLRPDRGRPILTGWWAPVAQHIYIEEWGTGLSSRGSKEPPHPPTENPNPIKGRAASDGMCPATAVVPLQVYTGPPSRHRAGAAPTPASTLLLCRNSERREGSSPDLRVTHTEVLIIDPNNGTRARLPLCNPNPNRVKEKRSKTGVADVTDYRSPPPPHGEKCHTAVLTGVREENKRRTSVFGSEKRKGKGSQEP